MFFSNFQPSDRAFQVLANGRILDENETPRQMVERVCRVFYEYELQFGESDEVAKKRATYLGQLIDSKKVIPSTPILTNAGRYNDRPLSACTMLPLADSQDRELLKEKITTLHQQGMGIGFDLSTVNDPVGVLRFINEIARKGAEDQDRPVGNMASLKVDHPKVIDFIYAKADSPLSKGEWKFNISVDLSESFFNALANNDDIVLSDGSSVSAERIFNALSEVAYISADPGVLFLERMNNRNSVPGLGEYQTTAPCAEVGLIEGETCQFAYVNVAYFVRRMADRIIVEAEQLKQVTELLTYFLDDAVEASIERYTSEQNKRTMGMKRKIGIGVCGVADAFSKLGLAYGSKEARDVLADLIALINYSSKRASIKLAHERGACGAMSLKRGNRYRDEESFLGRLYGRQDSIIDNELWFELNNEIKKTSMLRNTSTVALPPTGRSALVIDASSGLEPHFLMKDLNDDVKQYVQLHIQKLTGLALTFEQILDQASFKDVDESVKQQVARYLATVRKIDPKAHLAMAVAAQKFTDESISKTVNMPVTANVDDVKEIFLRAWQEGLNGVTVYVDKTYTNQPKAI